MRVRAIPALAAWAVALLLDAPRAAAKPPAPSARAPKPETWCAPETLTLSDHVCYAEGPPATPGRHTLVVYLHGALAETPGFAWLQHRAMAMHAKRLGFTVLLPTSPRSEGGRVWPTSQAAQAAEEAAILQGLASARRALQARVGHGFDEVFVVGFSSGAYYASSLAVRGALDVDGYIVLAGGASWVKAAPRKRVPIFVGVSAADPQTANHSRAFGGAIATLGFPHRVEERNVGHMVDWTFMAHGIAWLRERAAGKP